MAQPPTPAELAAMLAAMNQPQGATMEPVPEATEPLKLDLKEQNLPGSAWLALEEEVTEEMPAKLIESLISYINKMDFPPRFKTPVHAYMYFGIMSEAQIARLNALAEEMANPTPAEPEEPEEPAA